MSTQQRDALITLATVGLLLYGLSNPSRLLPALVGITALTILVPRVTT